MVVERHSHGGDREVGQGRGDVSADPTGHRAPCAENAIINVKVIGASQEMSNYLPLPSKSCQWLKGGAGRSETLEKRHSSTNISKRLWSSEK